MPSASLNWRYIKIFLNLMVVCVFLFFMYENKESENELCARGTHIAQIGNGEFVLHVLDAPLERERGLSGHAPLREDEGELFVFDGPTEIGFWMKDMLFPIDIIFLDGNYRVIGLVSDARPESYPQVFMSPKTMRYTIEVASGAITQHAISVGSTIGVHKCTDS